MAISSVLLAQVSQAIAQGPDASPTMDFFEFLGSWNDDEGNFIDPMVLDAISHLDDPIQEHNGERLHIESGEEDSEGSIQESDVDDASLPNDDE